MSFQEVPYIVLSGNAKNKAVEVLGTGNTLLRKWADFFPNRKFRILRNQIMNHETPMIEGVSIPADKLSEFNEDLPLILTIKHERRDFLECRTVEEAVLQGFAALAKQHAKKWALDYNPLGLTFQDFLQEAYMQVIEAMYSWLPEHKVELSTYIWIALKNRMSNVANQQGNSFCPLSNPDLELFVRYKRLKNNMHCHATFDEIVSLLGLTEEQGLHLSKLLARVVCGNQMNSKYSKEVDDRSDYSELAVSHSCEETEIVIQNQSVKNTLNKANLTTLERKLIELAMDPYPGWQTEFANNNINPATKKPYSRMRITQILKMARDKVAGVLELEAA